MPTHFFGMDTGDFLVACGIAFILYMLILGAVIGWATETRKQLKNQTRQIELLEIIAKGFMPPTGFLTGILTIGDSIYTYNLKKGKMNKQIQDTQTPFTVEFGKPVDAKGNETSVQDGSVAWNSSDETVATVSADADNPLKATVTPTGKTGTATIEISVDADLGEGVTTITGSADITVIAGNAVGFGEPTFTGV